ncbi:MAG: hypothetical protein ACI8Z5_001928 [Lentimonas sp.]|jgi:hypothetical protein
MGANWTFFRVQIDHFVMSGLVFEFVAECFLCDFIDSFDCGIATVYL